MVHWIPRSVRRQVDAALRRTPAVLLFGPRQVGKSTLARRMVAELGEDARYLDPGLGADRHRLQAAASYLRAARRKLVVIDEVHRVPDLFRIVRGLIDERRAGGDRYGRFLLLGSASGELLRQTQDLGERVTQVEMTPLLADEAARAGMSLGELWLRGGLPESVTASGTADSLRWRHDLVRSYLDRDLRLFAPRLPAETIGRLWTMLAHAQGAPLNRNLLAAGLEVSAAAVKRYLELLVKLLLVRSLPPWRGDVGKRLVRAPKTYIRDSGLLHALLDIDDYERLLGHPVVAPSWEGFVIEHLIAAAGRRPRPCYYRTQNGAQIDLLFERGGTVELAIAIRRSAAAPLPRGFHAGCNVVRPRRKYLVHGGEETGNRAGGVTVIGVRALVARLAREAAVTGLRGRAERLANELPF